MNIPTWFWGFPLVIVGWLLARLQKRLEKREEQTEAVAALRYELEFNLRWLGNISESLNYLRDEAWLALKNKGYISYLQYPVPLKVIEVYAQLHSLNRQIDSLRNSVSFDKSMLDANRDELIVSVNELITLLDTRYPSIGRNFRKM